MKLSVALGKEKPPRVLWRVTLVMLPSYDHDPHQVDILDFWSYELMLEFLQAAEADEMPRFISCHIDRVEMPEGVTLL